MSLVFLVQWLRILDCFRVGDSFLYIYFYIGDLFIDSTKKKADVIGVLLFILASLTRPEAPIFLIPIILIRIYSRFKKGQSILKREVNLIFIFLFLYGGYFLFRYFYFGHVFPNSVYFKSIFPFSSESALPIDGLSEESTKIGLLSVNFLKSWLPFHILSIFSLFSSKKKEILSIFSVIILAVLVFANTEPLISHFDRFFLPFIPLLLVTSIFGLKYLFGKVKYSSVNFVGFIIIIFLIAWQIMNPYVNPKMINDRAVNYKFGKSLTRRALGNYLNNKYGENGSIAVGDVGLIGYIFKGTIYDMFGLNDYTFTIKYRKNASKYADYILAKKPDAIVICVKNKNGAIVPRYKIGEIMSNKFDFKKKYIYISLYKNLTYNYHYSLYERKK